MRKLGVILAAVLLVLLLLVLGLMLALESRWFSEQLSGFISDKMGREVEWASLDIDWSLHPVVTVQEPRINNASWANYDDFSLARTLTARIDLSDLLKGLLVIEQLNVAQPEVHLAQSSEYGNNWDFLIPEEVEVEEPLLRPVFQRILLDSGELTFVSPEQETDINVSVNNNANRLLVQGDGQLVGHAISFGITGDPLREALNEALSDPVTPEDYTLRGQLSWRGHELRVVGQSQTVSELGPLQFDMVFEGPSADALAELFGYNTRDADYRVEAQIEHLQQRWSVRGLDAQLGDTELRGTLALDYSGARPRVMADIHMTELDVDETLPMLVQQQPERPEEQQLSLQAQLNQWLAPLENFDADVTVELGQLNYQQATVRELLADVQLQSGILTVQPVGFDTGEGRVELTGKINATKQVPSGHANLALESIDLGQALSPFGFAQLGNIDGNFLVELEQNMLSAGDSRLRYWGNDGATDVTAQFNSRATDAGAHGAVLDLSGQVDNEALEAQLVAGPLLYLANPEPSTLQLDANFADTDLTVDGTVLQPLLFKDAKVHFRASSEKPAKLQSITGINIPQLPTAALEGRLLREDNSWYVRDIEGQLGESDISGDLRWQLSADQRPMVWANLRSTLVDMDDVMPASSSEEQTTQQQNDDGDVLPETNVFEPLQLLNAHIEYDVDNMRVAKVPLDDVRLDLWIENGQLRLTPLDLGVGRGSVNVQMQVDASSLPATGQTDLEISRVNLQEVLQSVDMADDSFGTIGGRGHFSFTGNSVAALLNQLQGQLHLIMSGGQIDALLVEAAGLDVGEVVVSLFGDEPEPVDIQCAFAKLDADSGIVDVEEFALATTDSNIVADGEVNFGKEEFELVVEAQPKDFSLFSFSSPIRVHGTFQNINVDVVSSEMIREGALALLGAAVFPPAALVPLAEAGDTSGQAGCQQLVAASGS